MSGEDYHKLSAANTALRNLRSTTAKQRIEIKELRQELAIAREALNKMELIRTASEDGERLFSCCNSAHVNETLMAGDRIYRLSYAHAGAEPKSRGEYARE